MKFLERKIDEIRSCINSMERREEECDTTIFFTMDDVEDMCFSLANDQQCSYCEYNHTRLFILRLTERFVNESNSNRYVSIVNWSDCPLYDISYSSFRDFPNFDMAFEDLSEEIR